MLKRFKIVQKNHFPRINRALFYSLGNLISATTIYELWGCEHSDNIQSNIYQFHKRKRIDLFVEIDYRTLF